MFIAQVARVQLQDAQSALAAEQADSKHLRDKLKMAQVFGQFIVFLQHILVFHGVKDAFVQSEAGLGKVQLETMTADLESAKRTTERLRTELQVWRVCLHMHTCFLLNHVLAGKSCSCAASCF